MDEDFVKFVNDERISSDIIDVKRIYIDLAGDLTAGVLLSQIIYWYLPSKKGEDKLRVEHDGYQWIANTKEDWWDQVRITRRQFDRAVGILEKKELVIKKIYKFKGVPTVHLRLNMIHFLTSHRQLSDESIALIGATHCTDTPNPLHQLVESSIAENTTKNTTESKQASKLAPSKSEESSTLKEGTPVYNLALSWCEHVGIDTKKLSGPDWAALKSLLKADIGIDDLKEMSVKAEKEWKGKGRKLLYLNSNRASLLSGTSKPQGRRYATIDDLIKEEKELQGSK